MTTSLLMVPAIKEISNRVGLILQEAMSITIRNEEQYIAVTEKAKEVKTVIKNIENNAEVNKLIADAFALHKGLTSQKKNILDPLLQIKAVYDKKMADYLKEKAEEETLLKLKTEETARKEMEKMQLDKAVALENMGMKEEADELLNSTTIIPQTKINLLPKVAGISTSKQWVARVVDLPTLIQAVADKKAPANLLMINDTVLRSLGKALGNEINNIPGLMATEEFKVSTTV